MVVEQTLTVTALDIADTAESLSEAAMQHKKESRKSFTSVRSRVPDPLYTALYQSLVEHSLALKSLQREHKKHLEREKALGDILDALRLGYNPNYQDMAVLEAVRGWEALAGLPHIIDVRKEEGSAEAEGVTTQQEEEVLAEGEWSADRLDKELDSLLKTDYETLLIQHDKHIGAPAGGSLCELLDPLQRAMLTLASVRPNCLHS